MTITTTAECAHTVLESPIGPLTLVAEDGVLVGLHMHDQRHAPAPGSIGCPSDDPNDGALGRARRQLEEYFAGDRCSFDVDVRLDGTPFQQRVWEALRSIPYGEIISYGELAARVGRPGAARAVGLANGRNPVAIIVPCHRVIGANGSLTGYGGGLERKQWLLGLEAGKPT
ncbi:MAG TPA: methylated-DNA--[protein]-cysteine S-methyltransferase [Acidimicrobiales bacterium]|nr:methylated-DNA--[protein]-cysteine S-methyltransferase [Acidimicrobiales bacterium]